MTRRQLLAVALAATLFLTAWVQWQSQRAQSGGAELSAARAPQPAPPIRLADRSAQAAVYAPEDAAGAAPLVLPDRSALSAPAGRASGALFAAPPAPAAPPPPPPPPPTAPPLPLTFGGRLVVGGEAAYLLNEGTRTLVLAVGATHGEFVLESADDMALTFRHQPTGLPVALPIDR